MKRVTAIILSLVLIIALMAGCSKPETTESTEPNETNTATEQPQEKSVKDTIVYAMWSAPDGLYNPLLSNTQYDGYIISTTFNGLLKYDDNMDLVGDLADNYEVSDDDLTLSFNIKEGVKWHDGADFTADDVAFTFESLKNPDYTGARADIGEMIESIAVDGNKVSFKLNNVNAVALSDIGTMGIIPKHIWEGIAIEKWQESTDELKKAIGTGPFMIDSIEEGQHIKLIANPNYFGGEVKTPNLVFKVANKDTVQVELKNGTVDIAEITDMKKADIDELKEGNIATAAFPNRLLQYMGFNLRDDRFSDIKVRQAFAYALDRPTVANALTDGKATLLDTPMIPSSWAYPEAGTLNDYGFNTEKAISLLEESGYDQFDANGFRTNKDGRALSFVLTYPSGHAGREKAAVVIKDYLGKIGVDVELKMLDFSTTMDEVVGNHEFDAYLMGNTLNADPNPKPYWHSTAASDEKGVYAWNISGLRNSKVDELMEQALLTNDISKRKELYKEFAVIMNEELPWIPLYCEDVVMGYNKSLENYTPSTYTVIQNVENWVIYQ